MKNYIIKKTKRKTMSIKINSKGEVVVSVPKNTTDSKVLEFINKHSNWIDSHLSKINDILKQNSELLNYEKIMYLGKKYDVIYVNGLKEISLKNDGIYVPYIFQKKIKKYLQEWYLKSFNEIIVNRTNTLLKKLKLSCNEIVAINSVYRWGTCSSDKKISFNYKLLMLDYELIDYVIVHEVCHLVVMNHQAKFWKKVGLILPNYKELIKKLKNYGFLLRNL
ncbi:MAG: M48 family metallopeptidase [Clostridia bacterium]|nr:M48 family metallopeptidase [Clostridia bacterium]